MMLLTARSPMQFALRIALFGLAYMLFSWASIQLFSLPSGVSMAWLPGGLALAVILLGGRRYAWGVLVAEMAFNALRDQLPFITTLVITLGKISGLLVGAWLAQREPRFDPLLRSMRSFMHLVLVCGGISSLISALVGATTLFRFVSTPPAPYLESLLYWWLGDIFGIVLITPLVLIWQHKPMKAMSPARMLEGLVMLAMAFAAGQIVFLDWLSGPVGTLAQGYWLFLFVIWAALRVGRHGVVLILPLLAVQGLFGVLQGSGIFSFDLSGNRLLNYWFFMLALSGVGMVLAVYLAELALVQSELKKREDSYYRQFSDNTAAMLLLHPDGRILDANKSAQNFYGFSSTEFLKRRIQDISCRDSSAVKETLGNWAVQEGTRFESRHRLADGSERDVAVTSSPVRLDDHIVLHTIVFDITDRKRAEAAIENLAFFDPLTQLPNRRLLLDRLHQALAGSSRSARKGAVLFIDLDNFKNLNDTHGHEKGDQLLQQVAMRLKDCVRAGDTVARLGGDEFVVMLKDLSEDPVDAAAQVEAVGAKALQALKLPHQLGNLEHHGSGSIGMALFGAADDSVEELFKRADLALYQAKANGRNAARFFDPDMQASMDSRTALEADMRQALMDDQFVLFYQAQVDAQGALTGAEVLVRWQHPQRGMVSPAQFIGLAEDTGLILPLGHWVLLDACRQLARWSTSDLTRHLTLSVNVSARQFLQQNFVQEVLDILTQTGAPAATLKLELTESLLVDDVDDIIAKMTDLKAKGVGFSLDDFGTGYSSLSYLKRLPLDQLKIDQSFVRDALSSRNDAAIAKTIVALGQSLGLMVIAEGVETQAQRDFLWSQGCYAYQGYFFGRPGPVEGLQKFLLAPALPNASTNAVGTNSDYAI